MHFRVTGKIETLKIEAKDAVAHDVLNTEFPRSAKRRKKGFKCLNA